MYLPIQTQFWHNRKVWVCFRLGVSSHDGLGTDRKDDFDFNAQTLPPNLVAWWLLLPFPFVLCRPRISWTVLTIKVTTPASAPSTKQSRLIVEHAVVAYCTLRVMTFNISDVDPTIPWSSMLLAMAMSNISPGTSKCAVMHVCHWWKKLCFDCLDDLSSKHAMDDTTALGKDHQIVLQSSNGGIGMMRMQIDRYLGICWL
jgi:hypothetical protein